MPHGAPALVGYGILFFIGMGVVVHWLRRATRHPEPTEEASVERRSTTTLFDRVQRSYHWLTTAAYVGVFLTGLALYDPLTFEPLTDYLNVPLHGAFPTYVWVHVGFSVLLGALLAVHVAWDVYQLDSLGEMVPRARDVKDALTRTRHFLGMTDSYPRMDKYDLFMKGFHLSLIVGFIVLALTGLYQLLFAPWWEFPVQLHSQIEPAWRPTLLHDIFGFGLTGLIAAHSYFALLPVNRPLLSAMVEGDLPSEEFQRRYRTIERPEEE